MKFTTPTFTRDQVLALLSYDPQTGIFTNLTTRGSAMKGTQAGYVCGEGYMKVGILGYYLPMHRLAWFMVHGRWPASEIDHKNRVRTDNRIDNLHEVSHGENKQNMILNRNNTSGHKGVSWHKSTKKNGTSKWMASIRHDHKRRHLGYFTELEDAARAYAEAAARLHKYNPVGLAQKEN